MTSRASVAGDERLRLFLALRLRADAVDEIGAWQQALLRDGVRVVPRDNLHVTLAFLGHRPSAELPAIVDVLRAAAADAGPIELRVERYRETRSVAMLVLEDPGGGAAALAADVQERLERLGVYRREDRPWLPHVTVARYRDRPRLRLEPPRLRTPVLIPSDAAAYLSRPGATGAEYAVLESICLGG
jgi:RNA 2',3'-cyclic 3'-phosphodiesterase